MIHHGYIVLFITLLLEVLALPVPGATLLTYAGYLVSQGELSLIGCMVFGLLGSIAGFLISHWIGRKLGLPFFRKYGARFKLGEEQIEKASKFLDKHGNKFFIIAFFLPGLRHIACYFSGIVNLKSKSFYASVIFGAFLWVTVHISFGAFLGPSIHKFEPVIKRSIWIICIVLVIIGILYLLFKKYQNELLNSLVIRLKKLQSIVHYKGRFNFVIFSAFVVSVVFVVLMIGVIQAFLANDYTVFNELCLRIIHSVFHVSWTSLMTVFAKIGSYQFGALIIVLAVIWVIIKGTEKVLEFVSMGILLLGGSIYEQIVSYIFHIIKPNYVLYQSINKQPFPNEQPVMIFVILGIFTYLVVRHSTKHLSNVLAFILAGCLLAAYAVSVVFLNQQYPIEVIGGFIFGGVWVSMNILLLEVYRVIRRLGIGKEIF
jgi:membrane protein DedA with SNARE-associated domain/membrane-associated phospholipid phosphatase